MPLPNSNIEWHLRYGNEVTKLGYALTAASIVEAYGYLVIECSRDEAWRRIKIIRAAMGAVKSGP